MSSEIGATIALGILSALLLCYGWRRGFFSPLTEKWEVPIRFLHLIGAFAIYFFVTFFSSTLVVGLFKKQILLHFTAYSSWLNFGVSFFHFLFSRHLSEISPSKSEKWHFASLLRKRTPTSQ